MEKKIFALVLTLCMTLALFGCSQGVDIRKEVREGEEKLTAVEECHLLVQLTVGHALELYLGQDGTVLKAASGEEEGGSFLTGLELIGLSYEEAVSAILSRAVEQGILEESTKVQIDVLASAEGPLSLEQTRKLEQAVADYNALLVPVADQSLVVAGDCGAEKVDVTTLGNGDLFYDYYLNGVAIRQVCYHTDGSCTEWIYDETGRNTLAVIRIWPDGKRTEERTTYENGIQISHSMSTQEGDRFFSETEYYDENGVKTGWEHTTREGDRTVTEEQHYENGQIVYSGMKDSDGFSGETRYYSDGTVEMTRERRPDGSTSETHYYPDGKMKTAEEHCPNGKFVYRYTACKEDGSGYTEEKMPDGSVWYSEFSANGMETFWRCTYANGDWEERSFYPNGCIKSEEGSVGGEYFLRQYDENGTLLEN